MGFYETAAFIGIIGAVFVRKITALGWNKTAEGSQISYVDIIRSPIVSSTLPALAPHDCKCSHQKMILSRRSAIWNHKSDFCSITYL